jgi:hypothetical protein
MRVLFLAQWSATDSANLQDIHDWIAQLCDPVSFAWGFGIGFFLFGGFVIYRALRKVFEEAGDV